MREYSVPALVDVPATAGLTDIVYRRGQQEPHAVMLRQRIGEGRWQDITAREFRDQVTGLAKGLIAAGIEPGDRVGLMSRTRYEWTLIDYAIWAAGAVTVPVYETSSAEQVEWILGDSGAAAVFAESTRHADMITSVRDRLASLKQLWLIDDIQRLSADGGGVTDEQAEQRRTSRGAADLATIIYTSGTTGRPKGCELTHGNLLSDVRNAFRGSIHELIDRPGNSTMLFLPLAHSFARIIEVG